MCGCARLETYRDDFLLAAVGTQECSCMVDEDITIAIVVGGFVRCLYISQLLPRYTC